MFITSITNFFAFLSGALTQTPAVKYYCIQLALACVSAFLLMLFLFVPALVYHARALDRHERASPPTKQRPSPAAIAASPSATDEPAGALHWFASVALVATVTRPKPRASRSPWEGSRCFTSPASCSAC